MRDNLLKDKHSGGFFGHFSHDTRYVQLRSFYYWVGMRVDVEWFVDI